MVKLVVEIDAVAVAAVASGRRASDGDQLSILAIFQGNRGLVGPLLPRR